MTRRVPPPAARAARLLGRLAADRRGISAVEFALVAPVFFMLLLGTWDMGQMVYGKALLNGAVEQAARSASLETGNTTAADTMVKNAVKPILPGATITSSRLSYYDFADVGRAEKWTDSNNNGTCDNGENFTDENKSGTWEANIGKSGNGGAGDVVLYTVTVKYNPIFTTKIFGGMTAQRTLTAVGVRKNQPYANQDGYGSSAGTCS